MSFYRKSVGAAEVAFGLTEEQRLAKEEEERNVALVEIQLRDEHSFPALGVSSHEADFMIGADKPERPAEAGSAGLNHFRKAAS